MHDFLTLLAVLVTWGLLPASLHIMLQLMVARSATKHQQRLTIQQQRLREWRTCIPYVTPDWPRRAHMDTTCQCDATLWHISYARDDAFAQEVTTCAQRALDSTHIHN